LETVFKKAEIQVTVQNKSELDKTIHRIVGVKYKDCSTTWKQVKKRLAEDENGFVAELKDTWNCRQTKN
jgi:hypothetical protein